MKKSVNAIRNKTYSTLTMNMATSFVMPLLAMLFLYTQDNAQAPFTMITLIALTLLITLRLVMLSLTYSSDGTTTHSPDWTVREEHKNNWLCVHFATLTGATMVIIDAFFQHWDATALQHGVIAVCMFSLPAMALLNFYHARINERFTRAELHLEFARSK